MEIQKRISMQNEEKFRNAWKTRKEFPCKTKKSVEMHGKPEKNFHANQRKVSKCMEIQKRISMQNEERCQNAWKSRKEFPCKPEKSLEMHGKPLYTKKADALASA